MTKPDLLVVVQNKGLKLKQRGKSFWSKCPLHAEKIPSFSVNPDKQVFYSFCCGNKGYVISFIKDRKGLSFKYAFNYLHLEKPRPIISPETLEKKQAIKGFKWWCKTKENELCDELLNGYDPSEKQKVDHVEQMAIWSTQIF